MHAYDVFYFLDGSWIYRRYYSEDKHACLGDYQVLFSGSSKCSIFILAFRDKQIR
ncbi:hypothetical protein NMI26_000744 [Salmonella enterica subsp. enterica serovar Braenderup]|nr:hypothetical protein [Salmonella enterica subsp. enterica serovar Braenderup]